MWWDWTYLIISCKNFIMKYVTMFNLWNRYNTALYKIPMLIPPRKCISRPLKRRFPTNVVFLFRFVSAASVFVTYRKLTKYTSNDFEDPTFTAMCSIDGAAGEPKFEIRFNGNEQHRFRVFLENSVIERKHYYHDGAYRATVKSPPQGQLICQVNDTRGSYKSSVDIAGKPIWLISFQNRDHFEMDAFIIFVIHKQGLCCEGLSYAYIKVFDYVSPIISKHWFLRWIYTRTHTPWYFGTSVQLWYQSGTVNMIMTTNTDGTCICEHYIWCTSWNTTDKPLFRLNEQFCLLYHVCNETVDVRIGFVITYFKRHHLQLHRRAGCLDQGILVKMIMVSIRYRMLWTHHNVKICKHCISRFVLRPCRNT